MSNCHRQRWIFVNENRFENSQMEFHPFICVRSWLDVTKRMVWCFKGFSCVDLWCVRLVRACVQAKLWWVDFQPSFNWLKKTLDFLFVTKQLILFHFFHTLLLQWERMRWIVILRVFRVLQFVFKFRRALLLPETQCCKKKWLRIGIRKWIVNNHLDTYDSQCREVFRRIKKTLLRHSGQLIRHVENHRNKQLKQKQCLQTKAHILSLGMVSMQMVHWVVPSKLTSKSSSPKWITANIVRWLSIFYCSLFHWVQNCDY